MKKRTKSSTPTILCDADAGATKKLGLRDRYM